MSSSSASSIIINKHPSAMITEATESQLEIFRQATKIEAMKHILETTNINVNYEAVIATAARYGRNKIVELLIAAGTDVNIGDEVIILIKISCYFCLTVYQCKSMVGLH